MAMRKRTEIKREYNELWDKVWWARHQALSHHKSYSKPKSKEEKSIMKEANAAAKRIEKKFGHENLVQEIEAFGLDNLTGRMSALQWVLGDPWYQCGDT